MELTRWLCHPIPVLTGSSPHPPQLIRASQPSARTHQPLRHPVPLHPASAVQVHFSNPRFSSRSLWRVLLLPSHQPGPTSFQLCLLWSSPSPPLRFSWPEPPQTPSTHWFPLPVHRAPSPAPCQDRCLPRITLGLLSSKAFSPSASLLCSTYQPRENSLSHSPSSS